MPKQKEVWFKPEEMHNTTLFMMLGATKFFMHKWPKLGLGDKLNKYFTLFHGDFANMCFIREEFDKQADFLSKKMIEKPEWAHKIMDKIDQASDRFFEEARELQRLNINKMSNKEIITHFKRIYKQHQISLGYGPSITWLADAEKERVTKGMIKMVEEQIKLRRLKLSLPIVFPILSTPKKESIVAKEEKEFLNITQIIFKNRKVRETFIQSELDALESELKNIDGKIYNRIIRHYKKYSWLPYQYRGPAYKLEEFLGRWQAFLREGKNPQKTLQKIEREHKNTLKEQKGLMNKLKFNTQQKNLIYLSQRMVYTKDYRKMALYHGMYTYEDLFKELGRRLGLSLDQMRAMPAWEIEEAALKNKFDVNKLNERLKFCVAYCDKSKYVVWTGKKAKDFLKKIEWEKEDNSKKKELTGTCACPGKARGKVKIINTPEEMGKMEDGDIMVSHNTFPSLVPAMKKAAALVSQTGGLTCHTAIVARELKIPSVVGVTVATKVLKDGDVIEVDATKGIIKKIK